MPVTYRIFATLMLLFVCVYTQGTQTQAHQMRSITGIDGLSDLLVNTIYKDSDGFIWFGTESAIDRFDGNAVVSYQLPKNAGEKSRVNAILKMPSGIVFIGSQAGLSVLSSELSSPEAILKDKINFPVNALVSYGSNRLFLATNRGLYEYSLKNKKLTKIALGADGLKQDNIFSDLLLSGSNTLYVLSPKTLFRYNLERNHIDSFPLPSGGPVGKMAVLDNKIYIAVRGTGIYPFDITTSKFGNALEFGNNLITDISPDNRGRLFISTDGEGVFCYSPNDKNTVTRISTKEGVPRLKSNSVYSIYADNLGLLWVGYYQMGVDYTPKYNNFFHTYSIPEASFSTAGYAVRSLAIDGSLKVIGTREGLFLADESDKSVKQFRKPEIRSNMLFCIKPTGNRRFLIGTYEGGLYELDANTKNISDFNLGGAIKPTTSVFSIDSDRNGALWIGTSDGLFRYRPGQNVDHWTFTNSQLPEGNVYEIFFDSEDRGWICTENGIALWDGTALRKDRFPPDFVHKQKIRDVYEDSLHNLYFIPDRGKVFKSDINISKYGYINLGADENVVFFFALEDNDNHLWFGTDKGIVRYDKKGNYHHFNIADGIPSQIFTLCPPLKDKSGDLYMGNSAGLAVLDFKNFIEKDSATHHPVAVSNVMSGGKNIMSRVRRSGQQYSITLNKGESDLIVYMSDFSYKPSQYFIAEYKLEGIDDTWHHIDGTKPISLYDLPSGDHKLRMRLQDDPRSETILTIRKPSDTNWALIAIIVILLFGAGYTYFIYRRHRLSANQKEADEATETSATESTQTEETAHISYRTTRLSDEECKRLLRVLDKIMTHDKPYCNPNMKSSDLASLAGTTSHALSFLFNQYLHKSYYDYVNEFRVEEFKRLVDETDISRYTMSALAEKCGFSSRTSFFRHFKAIMGITPAEYIKHK